MGPTGGTLWSRLAFGEKLWATAVSLFLISSDVLGLYDRAALPFLQSRVGLYGFQPAVRMCDEGSFSRLIEVFGAIEKGAISASLSPTAAPAARG
jgi:hypothetical protein